MENGLRVLLYRNSSVLVNGHHCEILEKTVRATAMYVAFCAQVVLAVFWKSERVHVGCNG